MTSRVSQYRSLYRDHPITAEIALIAAALFAFRHWFEAVARFGRRALPAAAGVWEFVVSGGLLYLGAFVTFAGAYLVVRDVSVSLSLPTLSDLKTVGWAVALPVALVVATDAVAGFLFGTRYSDVILVVYGTATSVDQFLATGVVWNLLTGVGLALLYQGVVQGSFRSVLTNDGAVVLTTAVASAVTVVGDGDLSVVPNVEGILYVAAFVGALCLVLYTMNNVERDWLFYVSYLPLLALVLLPPVHWILTIDSGTDVIFPVVQVTVLGVAAVAYDQTDSLLAPIVTYSAFLVSGAAVAYFLEAVPA